MLTVTTKYLGCLLVIVLCMGAYYSGYQSSKNKYLSKYYQQLEINQQIEKDWAMKQHSLVSSYTHKITEMRNAYESDIQAIRATSLRDTTSDTTSMCKHARTASTVPREASNKSNIRCYTETQLLSKIKESLAIARECDELSIKYNTLLKVCKND